MKICSKCKGKIRTNKHHGNKTKTSCSNACRDSVSMKVKVRR